MSMNRHSGPGARESRPSSVASFAPSSSATATYQASESVTFSRSAHERILAELLDWIASHPDQGQEDTEA
jgi:hypothetical protein